MVITTICLRNLSNQTQSLKLGNQAVLHRSVRNERKERPSQVVRVAVTVHFKDLGKIQEAQSVPITQCQVMSNKWTLGGLIWEKVLHIG